MQIHHIRVDINSFKTNFKSIILKLLTSYNWNRFKDTENLFHFLVLSSSFLFFLRVGTWNILKVLQLMFWLRWSCFEWLLQFEVPWEKRTLRKVQLFIRRKLTLESLKQDQYRWSTCPYSIQITPLLWVIATKP